MEKQKPKGTDWQYIKNFLNIKVKNICRNLGLEKDYANVMRGVASKNKIEKVKNELEKEVKKLND